MISFNKLKIKELRGKNKLIKVNSPNKLANINRYILVYLFFFFLTVNNINKSKRKFIIINRSIYIIILSPI